MWIASKETGYCPNGRLIRKNNVYLLRWIFILIYLILISWEWFTSKVGVWSGFWERTATRWQKKKIYSWTINRMRNKHVVLRQVCYCILGSEANCILIIIAYYKLCKWRQLSKWRWCCLSWSGCTRVNNKQAYLEILRHLLNANCGQSEKIAVFQCEIECIAVATMIIVLKFAIVLAY